MLAIDSELLGYLRIGALVWRQMNAFLQEACLFLCEILQDWSWFLWLYEIVLLMAFSLVFPHIWVWMILSLLKIIDLLARECSHNEIPGSQFPPMSSDFFVTLWLGRWQITVIGCKITPIKVIIWVILCDFVTRYHPLSSQFSVMGSRDKTQKIPYKMCDDIIRINKMLQVSKSMSHQFSREKEFLMVFELAIK